MAPITSRGEGPSQTPTPIIIAGFCIAGTLLVFGLMWLGIRYCRKRPLLIAVGVVKDVPLNEKSPPNTWKPVHDPDSSSLSVPEKAVTYSNPSRSAIVQQTKICPRPSTATTAPPPKQFESGFRRQPPVPIARESVFSINSASTRFSVTSSTISMSKRKVHQIFDPIMPDELVILPGERLTVMQSFQDGWCIVCRPILGNRNDVEIGVIPAWCFLKPVTGLRSERPLRLVSLGVTAQSHYSPRPEIFSWSNF